MDSRRFAVQEEEAYQSVRQLIVFTRVVVSVCMAGWDVWGWAIYFTQKLDWHVKKWFLPHKHTPISPAMVQHAGIIVYTHTQTNNMLHVTLS